MKWDESQLPIRTQIGERSPFYQYEPLPPHCVRVLHLAPESAHNTLPLHIPLVRMEVLDLRDKPQYLTLSYTWQNATRLAPGEKPKLEDVYRTSTIACEGKFMLGTRNLVLALLRIRQMKYGGLLSAHSRFKPIQDLPIWIDALSINQEDVQERNAQVAIMSTIYERSQYTLAWLGESDDEGTTNAGRILQRIHSLPDDIYQDLAARNCHGWFDGASQKRCGLEQPLTRQDGRDLCRFFAHTWFSRNWVLQEIILSQNMMVMCGGHCFEWSFFEKTLRYLRETQLYTAYRHELQEEFEANPELKPFISNHAVEEMMGIVEQAKKSRPNRLPFADVMVLASTAECMDPRDKVYGCLGISRDINDEGARVVPDYNKPVADVYVEALGLAIAGKDGLAHLNLFQDPTVPRRPELPTWCPDYSSGFFGTRRIHPDDLASPISRLLPVMPASIVAGSHLLSAHGIKMTQLEATCGIPTHGESTPSTYTTVLQFIEKIDFANSPYASLNQSHAEVLWRTLLSDSSDGETPARVSNLHLMAQLTAFLWTICNPGADLTLLKSDLDAADQVCARLQALDPSATPFLPPYSTLRDTLDDLAKNFEIASSTQSPNGKWAHQITYNVLSTSDRWLIKSNHTLYTRIDAALNLEQISTRNRVGEIREVLRQISSRYNLFRTSDGYLGTGTLSAQPDDEVWVLSTGPVPYILRPLPNGHYQFLGRAHIHGFCHGHGPPEVRSLRNVLIE